MPSRFPSQMSLDEEKLLSETNDDDCLSQDTPLNHSHSRSATWKQFLTEFATRKSLPNWIFFSAICFIALLSSTIPILSFQNCSNKSFVYCKFSKFQNGIISLIPPAPAKGALEHQLVAPKADMAYYPPFTDESDRLWGRWEDSKIILEF